MMMKTFGFLVCLFATMSASQAALLARYTFTSDKAASSVAGGVTAGNFSGIGPLRTSANTLLGWYEADETSPSSPASYNVGSIALTPDTNIGINLSRIVVKYRARGGNLINGKKIFASVSTSNDSFSDPTGTGNTGGGDLSSNNNNFYTWNLTGLDIAIKNPGLTFTFSAFTDGSTVTANNRKMNIDSIEFYGDVVPEPASMAIFGLLGVGAAAGRFRRRK